MPPASPQSLCSEDLGSWITLEVGVTISYSAFVSTKYIYMYFEPYGFQGMYVSYEWAYTSLVLFSNVKLQAFSLHFTSLSSPKKVAAIMSWMMAVFPNRKKTWVLLQHPCSATATINLTNMPGQAAGRYQ